MPQVYLNDTELKYLATCMDLEKQNVEDRLSEAQSNEDEQEIKEWNKTLKDVNKIIVKIKNKIKS